MLVLWHTSSIQDSSDSMFYPLTLCAIQIVFMIMIMIIILGLISFFCGNCSVISRMEMLFARPKANIEISAELL